MYCLDTNIIIELLRGNRGLRDKIEERIREGSSFFITPITLCELYKGAYLSSDVERALESVKAVEEFYGSAELDGESCRVFGEVYGELRKKGKMTEILDLMIASIAKSKGLVLVTRNKKHFANTGADVEVW